MIEVNLCMFGGRGGSSSMSNFTYEDHLAAIRAWANTDEYQSVRSENSLSRRTVAVLEDFISKSPGVSQNLMRGVSVSDADLASIEVGGVIDMRGISSWSTRKGIAQSFARNNVSDAKPNQVVFTLKGGSSNAAKLPGKAAGGSRYNEGEALMSGKTKLKVVSRRWDSWGRTEVEII